MSFKTYDFKCGNKACGFIWEEDVEKHGDVPPCPNCDSPSAKVIWLTPTRMQRKKQPYDYIGQHRTDDPISVSVPKSYKGKKKGAQ